MGASGSFNRGAARGGTDGRDDGRASAIFFAILACATWGVSFLAPRVLEDVPSSTLAFARFLFFGVSSAVALGMRAGRLPRWTREATREALLLALCGWSGYYALLSAGVKLAGVPFATAVIGLLPMTILLTAARKGTRSRFLAPAVLLAAGAWLVPSELFTPEYGALLGRSVGERALGLGASLCALGLWTFFSIRNSRFLLRHPEWSALDWAGALGVAAGLTSGLILVASGEAGSALSVLAEPKVLGWGAFMGIAGAWGATALWNRASRALSPAAVGQLIAFESVFGLLYAFAYERRAPGAVEALAIACLLGGSALATRILARSPELGPVRDQRER
jgi:drug/metabolite transporter (DMT)-like permease